jgi:hypothetical protein
MPVSASEGLPYDLPGGGAPKALHQDAPSSHVAPLVANVLCFALEYGQRCRLVPDWSKEDYLASAAWPVYNIKLESNGPSSFILTS